ncbi:MAG: TonB-dependent receptor plug [Acidobacteriaceae bacterium]|nr:TonB-dependent receptor plug [Acidobacteriaceae bacterium]
MHVRFKPFLLFILFLAVIFVFSYEASAQNIGGGGSVQGKVVDSNGAAVPNAKVEINNRVSGYHREITSGAEGTFTFHNLPENPYQISVTAAGFAPSKQVVDVKGSIPAQVNVNLSIAGASTTVEVKGEGEMLENDPTFHTDIDRGLFEKLPLESQSSSVSSLVTLASPGVVADSNGLFHGLGDHAENSFSVDGQPITDQQSKVFSNQIPVDSIQSLEVISGAPPAEYGGKTSLVINVTTRSGLGQKQPTGSITTSYGSFGTATAGADVAFGSDKWGNFVSASGLNTGRFLDPPEFQVIHSKGNEQNLFDRFDVQLSDKDTAHLNLGFTRSWFQQPNSFDQQAVNQDQRAQIETYNIAPSWTHLFSPSTLLAVGAFVRHDDFNYYPSSDPFADQPETLSQRRRLLNAGIKADLSYVKGKHNIKGGITFQHTLLTENFAFGITDPTVNAACLDASGSPDPSATPTDPALCTGALTANPAFASELLPFDLTRGGTNFGFHGKADIKEVGMYLQDAITMGNLTLNLGMRADIYRGIATDIQPEPRVGIAYNIKPSHTVLRLSYARVMETPFNENLVLASSGGNNPVISALFGTNGQSVIRPGQRNQFNAGFQQALGKHLIVDADYQWKFTRNAYDFSDFLNTPVFFPIAWHNSKIDGASVRVSMPETHGFTAFVVMGHVNARFFPPQVGGLGTDLTAIGAPFRIDHDQKFNQTTHLQYQPWKAGPWFALNWRYDSGLVAGAVPFATDATTPVDLTGLTADQQMQAGLFCGSQVPTLAAPLTTCAPNLYGSTRLTIPAPGTQNDDHNPARVAPRNLFDLSVKEDNLFRGDRYKWSLGFTAINVTNKVALYNFLSTFSGTHFVTPRTLTVDLGFHF